MISQLRDRPVFICGHPKSGTSLLRALLDSHPQLVAYPEETHFFRRYLPKSQGRSLEEKLSLSDQYLTHIFEWNTADPPAHQRGFSDRDYSHISKQGVRDAQRRLVTEKYKNDGDILSAAILAYGQVAGSLSDRSQRWVEKTPYNEYYARQIFTWWPEAICVHMVRDPRDNYVSYHRKHPDWPSQVFALSWRYSTHAGMTNRKKYGSRRYLLIRYEDLTDDSEGVIAFLCTFLGIDDDPALREPTRGVVSWGGNSMFADQFRGISGTPVGRWHGTLSNEDRFAIETLASAPMEAMHYERSSISGADISWPLRLQVYKNLLSTNVKEKFK